MNVGIGILSYNRPDSLRKCLDSLFDNLALSANVVVSFDLWNVELKKIAESYPVSAISGNQQGIPFANNRLLKYFENYDAIFLVQDDIRFIRPEWLEYYLRGLNIIPYLAFFDTYYPQDISRPRHFKVNYLERRQLIEKEGERFWRCHKSPQGAFQAFSRTCIEQVGYFDVGFGVYGLEHHDYWLRTCNAGFSPPDHFYDIEQSIELLKIDWSQAPSLTYEERETAYQHSKVWRRKLFSATGEGFRRVKVLDNNIDIKILKKGPEYNGTPLSTKMPSDFLSKDYWVYQTRIPVLCFHAIDDNIGDRYAIPPAQFKIQVTQLAQHFQFITACQASAIWREKGYFPNNLAILTFDDAYQDIINLVPILTEFNIKATIFVPVNWVGQDNSWDHGAFTRRMHLDWEQLRYLNSLGHEIGSHGLDHYRLTMLMPEQAEREIRESKNILMKRLNQPIHSIAYPFGSTNTEILRFVQAHYTVGFVAGNGGVLDWKEQIYSIRRIVINAQDDLYGLLGKIANYMTVAPNSEPVWIPVPS